MNLLTVAAALDRLHHQIFGCDKGQIFLYGLFDDLLVYMKSIGNILRQSQDCIGTEKAFRQRNTAVRRVVQGSFKPLC